jgi:DNA polymerase-3 subunit alpha
MNALYRPGALGMNMVDSYIDRKHGREEVTYGHDAVKKILGTTYGVIVYQEQVMQIAQELSGFTLGQADILRRAMGKKKKEEMERLRSTFVEGAVSRNVNKNYAVNLFDQIEQFAGYGFNRSHSVGYALIAYQTAWLKAHYPAEFMASLLSCEMDSTDRIQLFVDDCRLIGLKVVKPDINNSVYRFLDLDSNTILYGLGALKGIGESLVNQITTSREDRPFADLVDFCLRVGSNRVNSRILTALIGSGSMDCFGKREKLFNQIPSALKKSEQVAERDQSNIKDLFGGNETVLDLIEDTAIRSESVDLLSAEWNSLGFYLESHPIETRKKEVRKMCGFFISELETETHSQRVAGMLMHLNVRQGRKGRFAFATLDDSSGRLEISIWADIFDRYRSVLKKGQLIVVEGVVEKDNYSSGAEKSSFKMVADRILTFDEARNEYLKHIKISLNPNLVNVEKIANGIKDLSNNEDGSPVLISFFGDKAKADILLSKDYSLRVNDDSITSLFELCGKENVDLVYHSGSHVN